jgi:hypothetical protein
MLRDRSYKAAGALTPDDSLMPLYRKLSDMREPGITIDGYEMVWDSRSEYWLFTHVLADWHNRWQGVYSEADGDHCHHRDFDKRNNNPTNIQRLPAEAHLALHREHVSRTLHRPEVVDKGRALRQSDQFRVKMSARMRQPDTRQILSQQAKAQWEDADYKAYMAEKWREFYASNEEYRRENSAQPAARNATTGVTRPTVNAKQSGCVSTSRTILPPARPTRSPRRLSGRTRHCWHGGASRRNCSGRRSSASSDRSRWNRPTIARRWRR